MNDITGADIRCPKCKLTSLTPYYIENELFLICACGYGKDEYFKAKEKRKKTKKRNLLGKIIPMFRCS